jgi:CCR4-NOT transcriptional regulation complex NOT5 subunit
MGKKISIDKDGFTSAVNTAASGATSIKTVPNPTITTTTLKPFTAIKDGVVAINKTIKSAKTICADDTKKMKSTADKIVAEDKAMADQFKKNTARF